MNVEVVGTGGETDGDVTKKGEKEQREEKGRRWRETGEEC